METQKTTRPHTPPARSSDEANKKQLELARKQGEALDLAVREMLDNVAHDGGEKRAGDFLVAFAVEEAEGMHFIEHGRLEWRMPDTENVHVEVLVRDAEDKRFVPGLNIVVTLYDPQGKEVGTHEQPFYWHSWLHHYGRNWKVAGDGDYSMDILITVPRFPRHDKINGNRYKETVKVHFDKVSIKTGQD